MRLSVWVWRTTQLWEEVAAVTSPEAAAAVVRGLEVSKGFGETRPLSLVAPEGTWSRRGPLAEYARRLLASYESGSLHWP